MSWWNASRDSDWLQGTSKALPSYFLGKFQTRATSIERLLTESDEHSFKIKGLGGQRQDNVFNPLQGTRFVQPLTAPLYFTGRYTE